MARLVAFAALFDVEEARALAVAGGAESLTRSIAGLAAPPEAKPSPEPPAPQLSLRSLANAIAPESAKKLSRK